MTILWNDKFNKYFTFDDWIEICRTICVHMCGYHHIQLNSFEVEYKWMILRLESYKIKKYLVCLSIGDVFGRIIDFSRKKIYDRSLLINTRETFYKNIMKKYNKYLFSKFIFLIKSDDENTALFITQILIVILQKKY